MTYRIPKPRPPTPKQLEILHWCSIGKSNSEIAIIMGISDLTVKNHMGSILRKLKASSRTQAVAIALRTGLMK